MDLLTVSRTDLEKHMRPRASVLENGMELELNLCSHYTELRPYTVYHARSKDDGYEYFVAVDDQTKMMHVFGGNILFDDITEDEHEQILRYRGIYPDETICNRFDWFMSMRNITFIRSIDVDTLDVFGLGVEIVDNSSGAEQYLMLTMGEISTDPNEVYTNTDFGNFKLSEKDCDYVKNVQKDFHFSYDELEALLIKASEETVLVDELDMSEIQEIVKTKNQTQQERINELEEELKFYKN